MQNRSRSLGQGVAFAALFVLATPGGAETTDVTGQWVGNSRVDGVRIGDKAQLTLGTPNSESSSLRIEGRTTCILRDGSYQPAGDGSWALVFKAVNGADACQRLAKGTFTLRRGASSRQLTFDVSYPGPDGQANLRRGALTRYP